MLKTDKFYDICYKDERHFIGYVVRCETDEFGVSTYVLLNSNGYLSVSDWDYTRFMVLGAIFEELKY
jgi:hypothetical protein